jgi:hypothetical protein
MIEELNKIFPDINFKRGENCFTGKILFEMNGYVVYLPEYESVNELKRRVEWFTIKLNDEKWITENKYLLNPVLPWT